MPKFFATVVYVIDADDLSEAKEYAEQLTSTPDCPAFVDTVWVNDIEEDTNEDPMDWDDDNNG